MKTTKTKGYELAWYTPANRGWVTTDLTSRRTAEEAAHILRNRNVHKIRLRRRVITTTTGQWETLWSTGMMVVVTAALCLAIAGCKTMEPLLPKDKAQAWTQGWCAGQHALRTAILQNRGHWRRLAGAAEFTHEEVIESIYSRRRIGHFAPRRLTQPTGPATEVSLVDSVDLYVIPTSRLSGETVHAGGQKFTCPAGEAQP